MENKFANDEWYLKIAMEQSDKAYRLGEVPVGAIIVDENGKIIGEGYNTKEKTHDPTGHAEIIAIKNAAKKLSNWRLSNCTLYVSLEPCPMCMASLSQARIKRVVFGAYDPKGGALSLGYYIHRDKRLNHRFQVTGGLNHYSCSRTLSSFFKERRKGYKK